MPAKKTFAEHLITLSLDSERICRAHRLDKIVRDIEHGLEQHALHHLQRRRAIELRGSDADLYEDIKKNFEQEHYGFTKVELVEHSYCRGSHQMEYEEQVWFLKVEW
jgi:hypothetical protein